MYRTLYYIAFRTKIYHVAMEKRDTIASNKSTMANRKLQTVLKSHNWGWHCGVMG